MKKALALLIMILFIFACVACKEEMVIICSGCASKVSESSQYCSNCGLLLFPSNGILTSSIPTTTDFPMHKHSFSVATCIDPGKCECGEVAVEPLGHNYGNATCTEAAVCSRCGKSSGSPLGHTWIEATCTTAKACSRCGITDGTAKKHSPIADPAVAASCTTTGKTQGSHCSVCNTILTMQTEIPATGHTYEDGTCNICGTLQPSEGLVFELSYDRTYYAVSGIGTCTDREIVIPSNFNGLPVTAIGADCFSECYTINSIIIPDSVTSIGKRAFASCEGLTSIKIPDSVASIGYRTFDGCKCLTSINIPDGVTVITSGVFNKCSSLTSIDIPSGVTSIEDYAFFGCNSLTSIDIPVGVTKIGDWAFSHCNKLISINIPNGVTLIPAYAFYYCESLASISIPSGITKISDYAFGYCKSLASVSIPDSVIRIGNGAFYSCIQMTSMTYEGSMAQWADISFGDKWNYKVTSTAVCLDGTVSPST